MTSALIGHGTEFWLDNDADTLTELAELTGVTIPNFQTDDVEATHFKSSGRVREYISGLTDPGEGDFEFNLVPGGATDLLLQAALDDGAARDYEIIIPDGAFGQKFAGDCIVKGYSREIAIDDRMMATATVRFTGAVTVTTLTS